MKTHTTNYTNTFIEVAEDCPVMSGEVPPSKSDKKSIANLQFDLMKNNPYKFSSDDVIFQVHALRNDLTQTEWELERARFFSKGQPCLRSSPLTKRYGWGVHSDLQGRVALYGRETKEYEQFINREDLKKVKSMRSKREK